LPPVIYAAERATRTLRTTAALNATGRTLGRSRYATGPTRSAP